MLTLHHVATELVSKGHEVSVDDVVVVVSLDLKRPKLSFLIATLSQRFKIQNCTLRAHKNTSYPM